LGYANQKSDSISKRSGFIIAHTAIDAESSIIFTAEGCRKLFTNYRF
jgi:hypothetical protein